MKIRVKLTPWAKKEGVEIVPDLLSGENIYAIKIRAKPIGGEANKALIAFLSNHFDTPKRNIEIVQGFTSRWKVVEIINYKW